MSYVPYTRPLADLPEDPSARWLMMEEVVVVRCTVCRQRAAVLRNDGLLETIGHPCGQVLDFDALRPRIIEAIEMWGAHGQVQKLKATPPRRHNRPVG